MTQTELMEINKKRVFKNAVDLFIEKGLTETTREDIAKKSKITVRTLNGY